MKPTDEQILEFIHAEKVWVWDDDPSKAKLGTPSRYKIGFSYPYAINEYAATFKNFSLKKPVVYEDGRWYLAKRGGFPIIVKCNLKKGKDYMFESAIRYDCESKLTNIRPISEDLWEEN